MTAGQIKHRSIQIQDLPPESEKPAENEHHIPARAPSKPVVDTMVEILQKRDGKDKTIKIIQYTSKLLMRMGNTSVFEHWYKKYGLEKRLNPLARELSMFRKVIKLFDWVKTLREIQDAHELDWIALVDLYTEIMDDLYFYAKIGVLNSSLTNKFCRQADFGWYIAILGNLYRKFKAPVKNQAWRIDVAKLLCDFVFCTIDIFEPPADSAWQIVSGLSSASIGYYKIWRKTRA